MEVFDCTLQSINLRVNLPKGTESDFLLGSGSDEGKNS